MRRLKQRGVSIIFISHALEEALQNADRITILRDGEVVARTSANFDRDKIIRAMVGRSLCNELYSRRAQRPPAPAGKCSASRTCRWAEWSGTFLHDLCGQITGVFGLIGSGRTETAKIVAGVVKRDFFHGGEVRCSNAVRYRVPAAVRDGIVYVTEDRKIEGFFETMSIAENLHMGALAAERAGGSSAMADMRKLAEALERRRSNRAINAMRA